MRSLIRKKKPTRRDPAPSKWGYRYHRLMLTPGVRSCIRIGTPLLLIAAIATSWFSDQENRALVMAKVDEAKEAVQQRPEFMVTELVVVGADERLETDVRTVLPITFPASSFDLNLENLRSTVAALNAVEDARIHVGEGNSLVVNVTPRQPVAMWRDNGVLKLIDADGVFVSAVGSRSDRLDLPLIAGKGAFEHIEEAMTLFERAGPLTTRVRGLVRMGDRRWDLVLDRKQRILLPENGATTAMDRVIALSQAHDLLDRDVAVVDMRNGARPTVRMSSEATTALRRISETETTE